MEIVHASQSRLEHVGFDNLGFGQIFSDHMFMADYRNGAWLSPRIVPYGNIEIPPSLCSLHYGQAIFEGLKAFRTRDGEISLFRPEKHQERFNRSAARLCIPPLSKELFMEAVTGLCRIDREWVPKKRGSISLHPAVYLRRRQLSGRARRRDLPLHGHHVAGGCLLQRRAQPRTAPHLR